MGVYEIFMAFILSIIAFLAPRVSIAMMVILYPSAGPEIMGGLMFGLVLRDLFDINFKNIREVVEA